MFKRNVKGIGELVMRNLRMQGLETPLLQKRVVDNWPLVAGMVVERFTHDAYIRGETLYVRLTSPALRADLSMRRHELVEELNATVKSRVINDIRFC